MWRFEALSRSTLEQFRKLDRRFPGAEIMSSQRSNDYLGGLIRELCKLPTETEWVEFKENNFDPKDIGEYISALANSAALEGKAHAYIAWGINDLSHEVVGTSFNPRKEKKGNEE